MPIVQRASAWRRARPWLSAVAVVGLVLGALAGPALAQERPSRPTGATTVTRLREPYVSHRTARPSTTIRFLVTYLNDAGSAPVYVRVTIDGRARAMVATSGSEQYRRGVRFAYATKLPAGRHRVRFVALSEDGMPAFVRAGTVRVVPMTSSGSPAGDSSSGSTGGSGTTTDSNSGADTSAPGSTPTAIGFGTGHEASVGDADQSPGAAAERANGSADSPGSDGGSPPRSVDPDASGPGLPTGAVDAADAEPGLGTLGPSPAPGAAGSVTSGGSAGGGGSGPAGAGGSSSAPIDFPGTSHGLFDGALRAYPVLVTTTGTVVVWAAFVFFGKRRRDGEPPAPDPVLAAHAATAPETQAVAALVPPTAIQQRIPPGADPTEAGLPRWRRPSLLQARKTDPLRTSTEFASLTFAEGAVEPFDGLERRRIRYRLVRLMDVPDEVRANEIGIVDEGDEVQVVDAQGTYRLVLCPDGQQGWLHKMVLGDLVDDESSFGAPEGIDEDVLSEFLSGRRQQSA